MNRIIFILTLVCATLGGARAERLPDLNIWQGTECRKKVKLSPYIVEGKCNRAVIVCPGGSYFWHDSEVEGHAVARWLNENGISAFVLDYRTAKVPAFITHYRLVSRGNRFPDPQLDLWRSLQLVRERAEEYGIDPGKVGAMGFSAGGHLVMSGAEMLKPGERPDFVVPVYPVVSMVHESTHKRSRRGLLGDDMQNDRNLQRRLSLELHVPEDCPPVFLVNCKDDPIVDYRNSELLADALKEKNIEHVYIQYETGGHGFGASDTKGTEECRNWRKEFIHWINRVVPAGNNDYVKTPAGENR